MSKLKGHKAAGCQDFQNGRSSFIRESITITRVNCLVNIYFFVVILIIIYTSNGKCTQFKTFKFFPKFELGI